LPIWQDHALPIFLGLVLFSESLFVNSILGLKVRSPKIAKFFSLSAILSALIIILSGVVPYRISIICLIVLALLINFVGLFVGIKQTLQGNKTAKLFTIAWIGTLLGAIVLALSKLGLIERNLFNENALHIGTVISVLWLSFALGEYITQQNRQRQQAKEDALEYALKIASEREEKLSAQEMALNIQQQANTTLELQVKLRTDQLEKTMSELELAHAKLKHISNLDELTGLYNRRYFNQKLNEEFLRAQRAQKPLAILIADIDYFKGLNDNYGHLAGDACLKAVSNVLKHSVTRPEDTVSRFGGEEFIILLPDTPLEGALHVAERLLKEVASEIVAFEGLSLNMTVSIGLTVSVPLETESSESILAKADVALYKAKDNGRNRVCQDL
jgi:diguanylate cyclase